MYSKYCSVTTDVINYKTERIKILNFKIFCTVLFHWFDGSFRSLNLSVVESNPTVSEQNVRDQEPYLLTACAIANPLLVLKNYIQDLLKISNEKSVLKRLHVFLRLTLLHMHHEEFPFQRQHLCKESINQSYKVILYDWFKFQLNFI